MEVAAFLGRLGAEGAGVATIMLAVAYMGKEEAAEAGFT
jgi:hypothetical protein